MFPYLFPLAESYVLNQILAAGGTDGSTLIQPVSSHLFLSKLVPRFGADTWSKFGW